MSLPNALTGVIDEMGRRFATYRYDSQGRAISSKRWADANGTLPVLSFDLAFAPNFSTSVTDALGAARGYVFVSIGGLIKQTSQSQPAGSGCGPSRRR